MCREVESNPGLLLTPTKVCCSTTQTTNFRALTSPSANLRTSPRLWLQPDDKKCKNFVQKTRTWRHKGSFVPASQKVKGEKGQNKILRMQNSFLKKTFLPIRPKFYSSLISKLLSLMVKKVISHFLFCIFFSEPEFTQFFSLMADFFENVACNLFCIFDGEFFNQTFKIKFFNAISG